MLFRQTTAMIAKDLRRELRTREVTITTVAFAILLMAIFAFAFYVDDESAARVFPGILWISVVFTANLAISRTFAQEKEGGCLRALALVPGTGVSLYLAKFVVNMLFVGTFELVLVPALVVVFDVNFAAHATAYLATLVTGTLGFVALGTLVAAMMVHNHLRDIMLPILLYPLAIPLIIGVVVITKLIVAGEIEPVWRYLRIVGAIDVAFFVLSIVLFRWVLSAIE
jgi:heme exporter protein B